MNCVFHASWLWGRVRNGRTWTTFMTSENWLNFSDNNYEMNPLDNTVQFKFKFELFFKKFYLLWFFWRKYTIIILMTYARSFRVCFLVVTVKAWLKLAATSTLLFFKLLCQQACYCVCVLHFLFHSSIFIPLFVFKRLCNYIHVVHVHWRCVDRYFKLSKSSRISLSYDQLG